MHDAMQYASHGLKMCDVMEFYYCTYSIVFHMRCEFKDLMQRKKKKIFFFLYRQYINKNIFHLKFFKNSH